MLKRKKFLRLIAILIGCLVSLVIVFWSIKGSVWTKWDFMSLDFFYRQAVSRGFGPESSTQIIYLTITDDTYEYFGKNVLDRRFLSRVNNVLSQLGPAAVAYDIIFSRPINPLSDHLFADSILDLGSVYLPIAFKLSDKTLPFKWQEKMAYEKLRSNFSSKPVEKGNANPIYGIDALVQLDDFAKAAFSFGHINAQSDLDGVYRHVPMLIRVDSGYVPTLSLSMFLDYANVSFNDVVIDWGNEIIIPKTEDSFLDQDVIIPIDNRGRAFIPFTDFWNKDFKQMGAHTLLKYFENENLQGNLYDFFEEKFVFIPDVSHGISDIGQTPLEERVPLVAIHAALLSGFLNNNFYREWSLWKVMTLIILIGILLGLSATPKSSWFLYIAGVVMLISVICFTWIQLINFSLFPIVAVVGSISFVFSGLIIGLQVAITRDQAFIRNAFSRYVPEKVVEGLLANPDLLQLGGEEKTLTVLFSDLESFTSISEKISPGDLVGLLNNYLTEMTDVILAEGGIIDNYIGDAVMAEFGAPIPAANHADLAVRAGLKMQRRLHELRKIWGEKGIPELRCRIGINTGPMIIGNMGSAQVFNYTVIGDAVNLAARLESANKQYNTYFMISEFTYESLSHDMFKTRIVDVIKVKGKTKAVKVFEVYGDDSKPINPDDLLYYQTYNDAFESYLSKDLETARRKFTSALSLRQDDPAAKKMISRIDLLNRKKLPEGWDGSTTLTLK